MVLWFIFQVHIFKRYILKSSGWNGMMSGIYLKIIFIAQEGVGGSGDERR